MGDALTGIFTGAMTDDGDFVTTSSFHGLAVQAASSEDIFGVAVSGGGGFVGVAGGIGVEVVKSTTKAYIGDAAINTDRAGAGASQSVNVSATNAVDGFTLAGGLGAGFVGIGGAVDIGIVKNTTQAYIGADSEVHASEDVDVNALSSKDLVTAVDQHRRRLRRRLGLRVGLDDRHRGHARATTTAPKAASRATGAPAPPTPRATSSRPPTAAATRCATAPARSTRRSATTRSRARTSGARSPTTRSRATPRSGRRASRTPRTTR